MTFALNEHHPSFQVPKPQDRFRIMFFGESALEGFLGRGFPAWFQAIAEATHPARTIEALNFGVGGTTSTAIRDWFFPCLEMGPDLIVFYIGNNELNFTSVINPTDHPLVHGLNQLLQHHSRTYQMLKKVFSLAQFEFMIHGLKLRNPYLAEDFPVFPASRRLKIEEVYRNNMRDMVLAARAKGIAVVIISPAANLKDWPPLKSFHYSTLTPEALRAFEQNLKKGQQELKKRRVQGSKVALEAALSIDPTYAKAHYLFAETLASLEDWDEARRHYQLACDWDDIPERVRDRFISMNLDLARAIGSHFLKLDQFLGQVSSPPIAGFDMFYDDVHFTYRGEYEVALALFNELNAWNLVPSGPDPVPTFDELLPRLSLAKDQIAREDVEKALILALKPNRTELIPQTVRNLEEAQSGLYNNPLPAILQALLLGQVGDWTGVENALAPAYRQTPYATAIAARRFSPESLEIYQNQAVMCFEPDLNWVLISLRVSSHFQTFRPQTLLPLEFGTIRLEKMSAAFAWDDAHQRFFDLMPILKALQAEKQRLETNQAKVENLDLLDRKKNFLHPQAMSTDWKQGFFRAESSDSYLVIQPFPADPLFLPILRIRAKISAPQASENWATIYWAGARHPQFSEDRKLTFAWPVDGQTRTQDIPLGRILRLLEDRPLVALRIDFTTQPAKIQLKQLELLPEKK